MVSYLIPGIQVTDHEVTVPLNWRDSSDTRTITVFAREVVDYAKKNDDLPLLLFLQGGPGGKSPRPAMDGWVRQALASHRVVLLDQRGTGRSTPVQGRDMPGLGTPGEQAAYLACFRADSIVADAEHLRTTRFGGRRWQTLGQSFGGFVTMAYLSTAPQALTACYVTGGLPGLDADARMVYQHTYPRVVAKNRQLQQRYPTDTGLVARVADRLASGGVMLPDGDLLTVHRFQLLGMDLGMKPSFERMHWLLDEAFAPGSDEPTDTFCTEVHARTAFVTNPLYAVLHEAEYTPGGGPTAWAAQAARPPEFGPGVRPLLFTGEMIYPWMFAEIKALRPFAAAAEILASKDDWPVLYDPVTLAANEVPVEAVVYYDDMYVDATLSLETASRVGNTQAWVTNEFEHDGLRLGNVFERLRSRLADRGGALG